MKKKHGTYSCATISTARFRSTDRSDSDSDSLIFTKPIDAARLQFKKDADGRGEREMRCKECKSNIGSFLPNDRYRANSAALAFKPSNRVEILEDIEDRVETPKDQVDAQNQSADGQSNASATLPTTAASASDLRTMLSGGVAGILIGAVGAFLICHATCAAPQTPILPALTIASSTPISATTTSSSSRPRKPPSSASTTPPPSGTATTSALQP